MKHQEAIKLINSQLEQLSAEDDIALVLREVLAEGKNLTIRIRHAPANEFVFAVMDMKNDLHANKTWLFALDNLPVIKQSFVKGGAMDVLFKHHLEGLVKELITLKKKLGTQADIAHLVVDQLISQGEL